MNYNTITNIKRQNKTERKRFLFFTGNIETGVGHEIWKGIVKKTKEIDVDLICLTGGSIGEDNRSLVYNLINTRTIDGCISHAVSDIALKENYYNKFKNKPFVALSIPIPNFPIVSIDSYQGIKDVVEHLVNVHSFTKIALVRGPKNHGYAIQRYNAYLDVVKKNSIYNENLITPPLGFTAHDGIKGVEILLDKRKLKPEKDIEAIVFISDTPALGGLNELTSRKIMVPNQIAITGCNAIPEAFCARSPLTTITMPFAQQSFIAIDLLLKQLDNKEVPAKTSIPAQLLVAQSCGCKSQSIQNTVLDTESSGQLQIGQYRTELSNPCNDTLTTISRKSSVDEILHEINKYTRYSNSDKPITTEFSGVFITDFFEEIENSKEGTFLLHFKELIRNLIHENSNIDFLQDIISILQRNLYKNVKNTGTIQIAENLLSQARVMTAEASLRIKKIKSIVQIKQEATIRNISVQFLANYDINILMDILVNSLPKLGIPSCYVSLYENQKSITSLFNVPEKARLIFAYEKGERKDISKEGILFLSKDLLPEGFNERSKRKTIVVKSLNFNEIQIGFIQFELGPEDGSIYAILSYLLSSALKGALLINETIQNSEKLNEAYHNLQKNQNKLLSVEKMASLGRLTAGIAHEMNTPLATIQGTMMELKNLVSEYNDSIGQPDVLPEDHREIAQEMEKCIELSTMSIIKSSSFIRGIMGQTISVDRKETEIFSAHDIITDTLNLLEFKFKNSKARLISEIDNTIVLSGNPRALSQIVTNLVNNALEASDGTKATITVILKRLKSNYAQLLVGDDGPGIPEQNLVRIFDPFFTTKPFGDSSGLGLGIVKDLVEQFKGITKVTSQNGITQFVIELPLTEYCSS